MREMVKKQMIEKGYGKAEGGNALPSRLKDGAYAAKRYGSLDFSKA